MASIELTDDWRQEEPLAWLVACHKPGELDYLVFADRERAEDYAEVQSELADDAGEPQDWPIYPLYAGIPQEEWL